jgi:transcriptional regulator with XRE-family HTH domain
MGWDEDCVEKAVSDLVIKLIGKNYSEVARKAGCTRAYVSSIAKGKRTNPSLVYFNAISVAVDDIDANTTPTRRQHDANVTTG